MLKKFREILAWIVQRSKLMKEMVFATYISQNFSKNTYHGEFSGAEFLLFIRPL